MSTEHPDQPGILRLIVDPGVWVSALISRRGAPDELIEAAAQGQAVIIISPLLLEEFREVVRRPKFRRYFRIEDGEAFATALAALAQTVEDPPRDGWVQVCRDPDDDYLVALAESTATSILVSGDKDLLGVQRPGLDVRSPRATVDALNYRHPWGQALIPSTVEAAVAQAEAEGHGPVLDTVSVFLTILADPRASNLLAAIVTPESLTAWQLEVSHARAMTKERGIATRPDYPDAGVAYVKLPPDPVDNVRATGVVLLGGAVIVTLQQRQELPGLDGLDGWRVHAVGDYILPEDLPKVHPTD